jgi:AraC family transcriptional regulator of adaptative response / DNA-3-methyladenine glycosylase II
MDMKSIAVATVIGVGFMTALDNERYAHNIVVDGEPAHIEIRSPRGVDAIDFEVHGSPPGALFNLVNRARRIFDLSVDPVRIESVLQRDPLLAPLIEHRPGVRIPGDWDGFECAVRSVLSQHSPQGHRSLVSRLIRSCGSKLPSSRGPGGSLTHLFPTGQALAVADLRGIGLAGPQIETVKALATSFVERLAVCEVCIQLRLPACWPFTDAVTSVA